MLGAEFSALLRSRYPEIKLKALTRDEWDIRDAAKIDALAEDVRGGVIIHCAALVNVEHCIREPELARDVIVGGTRNVIALAQAARATIFYPQSFLVFDGRVNPIDEDTKPNPLSYYGSLKHEAKNLIKHAGVESLIVRMAGFFGGCRRDKNFVGKIIPQMHAAIKSGKSEYAVGDRIWQPTYTVDIARNCMELIQLEKRGTYTMACHGQATFREIAMEIVDILGWTSYLKVVKAEEREINAQESGLRPACAIMENRRLKSEGLDKQRAWRDSLAEYLSFPYFDHFRMKKL
jgi:dTDP-4-dehydrorhamnose reductase